MMKIQYTKIIAYCKNKLEAERRVKVKEEEEKLKQEMKRTKYCLCIETVLINI